MYVYEEYRVPRELQTRRGISPREILKFSVSKMPFPTISERHFNIASVLTMISINKKCKIQGQVTTLQIMPSTYNRKPLKKPTNFSSRHVRICVKDAKPPQTFLSFHVLLCHSLTDCRTCYKNLRLLLVYIYVCIPLIVLSALFFLIFMPIIFQSQPYPPPICFAPDVGEIGYSLATTQTEYFMLRTVYSILFLMPVPISSES